MKFTIQSSLFFSKLQIVSKTISPKTTMPILSNILFEVNDQVLSLTAADAATRITLRVNLIDHEGENGSFVVSPRVLLDPIKDLPEQPITFNINMTSMEASIEFHNGNFGFMADKADAYPNVPVVNEELMSKRIIPAESLLKGIDATIQATSRDDKRPIMTGIHFDFLPDKLCFVASDSRILFKYEIHSVRSEVPGAITFPGKAANLLKSLFPLDAPPIQLYHDNRYAIFTSANETVYARLHEGKYPKYESVIPKDSPIKIIVERSEILGAVKRTSYFTNQASRLLKLYITGDQIKFQASDTEYSIGAEESVKCETNAEVNMLIGFDAATLYLLLNLINTEKIEINMADQTRAALILPETQEKDTYLCELILPMKIFGEE